MKLHCDCFDTIVLQIPYNIIIGIAKINPIVQNHKISGKYFKATYSGIPLMRPSLL